MHSRGQQFDFIASHKANLIKLIRGNWIRKWKSRSLFNQKSQIDNLNDKHLINSAKTHIDLFIKLQLLFVDCNNISVCFLTHV